MNYTRGKMDAVLAKIADSGLQIATHAHGDVAIDTVLDAYAATLDRHGLMGTDHRWRIEHWSAGSGPIPSRCRSWNLNPTRRLSVHAARRP